MRLEMWKMYARWWLTWEIFSPREWTERRPAAITRPRLVGLDLLYPGNGAGRVVWQLPTHLSQGQARVVNVDVNVVVVIH